MGGRVNGNGNGKSERPYHCQNPHCENCNAARREWRDKPATAPQHHPGGIPAVESPLREKFSALAVMEGVAGPVPLYHQEYRQYIFPDGNFFHIAEPLALYFRPGAGTHVVIDHQGVAYAVPFPNLDGKPVVLSWKARDGENPVATI